jgi:predicted nucleotidyltransferase component of viral defense system
MTEIPIILRLKKQRQKDLASAQDILVKETFSVFENAVLHGGTAIWRCYNGNRFSEDVDVYIPKDEKRLQELFTRFERAGFKIEKKKISDISIFSSLILNRTAVRFEALFKKITGVPKEYEKCNGAFITIRTLTPEHIIKEKVQAYQKRLRVRDMYDIFFLLRHVKDKNNVKKDINEFINNFKNPIDETNLKEIVLEYIIPSVTEMLNYIRGAV